MLFVSLVGLLVWGLVSAPNLIALASQGASLPLASSQWIGSLPTSNVAASPTTAAASTLRPADVAMGNTGAAVVACSAQSASAMGSNLVIPANEWVCGDAVAVGGNVDVQGHVQGAVQAVGGNVTVSGEVDGDVTAVGGNVTLASGAITRGSLRAVGGTVTLAPGVVQNATVADHQQSWWAGRTPRQIAHPFGWEGGSFWLSLLFWVSASVGLTAFVPEAVGHVRFTIARRMLVSGAVGAVIALAGVVVGAVLFLTCLGIPVTLVIVLALWVAWVVGTVGFGSWLGATFLRGLRLGRDTSLMASSLVGALILTLLKAVPVVGGLMSFLVGCVAVGAAILTLLSARRVSYAHLRW